jgi:hypothetical protein
MKLKVVERENFDLMKKSTLLEEKINRDEGDNLEELLAYDPNLVDY